jgi:hypothetical protein
MWEAYSAIALVLLCGGFTAGLLAERWHAERDEYDAQIDAYQSRIESNRRGRHARTEPRTAPARSGYRDSLLTPAAAPPWPVPGPVQLPKGGAIAYALNCQQGYASAASIDVVHLPPPAPAPDLRGAADTGRLPSLGKLTDTGAFEAISDWGDRMQAAIETGIL